MDLAHLIDEWHRLGGPDDGGRAFGAALGAAVPYSGTIAPRVELLEVGHARVAIDDRPEVRNHLGSVHALASPTSARSRAGSRCSARSRRPRAAS